MFVVTDLSTLDVLSSQMDTVWKLCVALWGDLNIQGTISLNSIHCSLLYILYNNGIDFVM